MTPVDKAIIGAVLAALAQWFGLEADLTLAELVDMGWKALAVGGGVWLVPNKK